MPATKSGSDTIVAYAKVIRLTDRLLNVADELREARKRLDSAAEDADRKTEAEAAAQ